MPARGPRRDLCVVVVTMSQYSNGCAASCAATRPLHPTQHPNEHHHISRLARKVQSHGTGVQVPKLNVCQLYCVARQTADRSLLSGTVTLSEAVIAFNA